MQTVDPLVNEYLIIFSVKSPINAVNYSRSNRQQKTQLYDAHAYHRRIIFHFRLCDLGKWDADPIFKNSL